ncbi:MAG: hypothetical protein C4558_05220 [Dehalococcoidia bacterium]|nr:MAG: hypothetical protein C4558_05220 [Dehalococcoidia bacterium]
MTQQSGPQTGSGLSTNVASALCYLIPFASIAFLLIAPYSQNPTVRFHALQSLLLGVMAIVISIVLSTLVSMVYYMMPLSWLFLSMVQNLVSLAFLGAFLFLAFRAFQGEMTEIPVVGEYARKYV